MTAERFGESVLTRYPLLYAVAASLFLSTVALAAENEQPAKDEAAAVAEQLANPNGSLGLLAFPLDYVRYSGTRPGENEQYAWKLSFQPSLPYAINESTNLFVRPLIPVFLDQPVPSVAGEAVSHSLSGAAIQDFDSTGLQLGDISFDVAIGRTLGGGTVIVGGVVGTLPTASDDRVGLDQYLFGPEFLLGQQFEWGFAGLLLTHQWDVAGEGSFDTSITGGQYFYTINLKNAWQIQAQPTFSYNHEADNGNRLSLPIGVGLSKTLILGTTPWKFSLQYWHYVEQPDSFGPEYQVRFQVAPVIPLPW